MGAASQRTGLLARNRVLVATLILRANNGNVKFGFLVIPTSVFHIIVEFHTLSFYILYVTALG